MLINSKKIKGKCFIWTLRCPTLEDAESLAELRVMIDGETENLYREPGEDIISPRDFRELINKDSIEEKNLFLVAEVDKKIVGFARCEGFKLTRFKHKAEFGICIAKEFWGNGIGKVMLEAILKFADETGIEKMVLDVVESNTGAIEMYKRYGFVVEGILVKDRKHKDGRYYNTIVMGRLHNI